MTGKRFPARWRPQASTQLSSPARPAGWKNYSSTSPRANDISGSDLMLGLIAAEVIKTFRRRTFWVLTVVLTLLDCLPRRNLLLPAASDRRGLPGNYETRRVHLRGFSGHRADLVSSDPGFDGAGGGAGDFGLGYGFDEEQPTGPAPVRAGSITATFSAWFAMLLAIVLFSVAAFSSPQGAASPPSRSGWALRGRRC